MGSGYDARLRLGRRARGCARFTAHAWRPLTAFQRCRASSTRPLSRARRPRGIRRSGFLASHAACQFARDPPGPHASGRRASPAPPRARLRAIRHRVGPGGRVCRRRPSPLAHPAFSHLAYTGVLRRGRSSSTRRSPRWHSPHGPRPSPPPSTATPRTCACRFGLEYRGAALIDALLARSAGFAAIRNRAWGRPPDPVGEPGSAAPDDHSAGFGV